MAKPRRKAPKLTAAETALVRAAMAVPPPRALPSLTSDIFIERWKAKVAAKNPSALLSSAPASEAPLRLAARSGEKISKETDARLRQLFQDGKRTPKPGRR